MPEVALNTDIIVGFPGETEEQFQQTLDLLSELRLDKGDIGDAGGTALAEALRSNTTVTRLNLEHNQLGDATMDSNAASTSFFGGNVPGLGLVSRTPLTAASIRVASEISLT